MKIPILILFFVLIAGNTFAQTDSLPFQNGINVPQSDLQLSDQTAHIDPEDSVSVLDASKFQLEKFDKRLSFLEGKIANLQEVNSALEGTFNSLNLQVVGVKSELDKSINKFSNLEKQIVSNTAENEQLTSKISLIQKENIKLEKHNDALMNSLISLEENYREDATNFSIYRKNLDDTLKRTLQKIKTNSAYIKKEFDKLDDKIVSESTINNNKISKINQNIVKQQYIISAVIIVIIFSIIILYFVRKKITEQQNNLIIDMHDLRKSLEEKEMAHDQKLTELIEEQLKVQNSCNVVTEQKQDHTFTLKVADEIVRIQKNLSNMDSKTKGLKQLNASVRRIQDNFAANGYELVEMLGNPYSEGMKVQANFVPDDSLEEGQEIISRIIKPQVNYHGVMIQAAQIEVSQG